jgi:pyruvate/2-oxoglutarate dehydrogenase complex dihydrolipoamide dehydrogenase (E3) component
MHEHDASAKEIELDTYQIPMKQVDRAVTDGSDDGFVKIHVKKGTDQILGATIVADHAGEMISEITLAMVYQVGLGKIASVIHPYPTQAEAIRKAADAYNRTRLTPLVKKLMGRWLAWTQ